MRWVRRQVQRRARIGRLPLCLVTGPPRSGTTAIADWLLDQPGVVGYSESRLLLPAHAQLATVQRYHRLEGRLDEHVAGVGASLDRYHRSHLVLLGNRLVVEKEPLEPIALPNRDYAEFCHNVSLVRPGCRFVVCVRHPEHTVASMMATMWGTSLSSRWTEQPTLDDHIDTWNKVVELVLTKLDDPTWHIVDYGQLLTDPERVTQSLARFLDLGPRLTPFEVIQPSSPQLAEPDRALVAAATAQRWSRYVDATGRRAPAVTDTPAAAS